VLRFASRAPIDDREVRKSPPLGNGRAAFTSSAEGTLVRRKVFLQAAATIGSVTAKSPRHARARPPPPGYPCRVPGRRGAPPGWTGCGFDREDPDRLTNDDDGTEARRAEFIHRSPHPTKTPPSPFCTKIGTQGRKLIPFLKETSGGVPGVFLLASSRSRKRPPESRTPSVEDCD
jgi:hypothetical protein